jgi:hypothetical protein
MGSKDPFNFDDIYKEAGVDSLFVKKSMAEQKAMAKPAPATPPRPQQQQNSPGLATSPGVFGQLQQRPAVSTTPVRAPMGGSKPPSASNLAGLDDPFAELGGISKPTPMAAQRYAAMQPAMQRDCGLPGTVGPLCCDGPCKPHSWSAQPPSSYDPAGYYTRAADCSSQTCLISNFFECACVCHCRTPVRSPTPPRAPEPQQPLPFMQPPVVQQPAVPAAGEHNCWGYIYSAVALMPGAVRMVSINPCQQGSRCSSATGLVSTLDRS